MRFLLERQYKDDLRGKQFGELTVIEPDNSQSRHSKHWICKCSCGKTVSVERKHLLDGTTKSCGHGKRQSGLDHYEDNFKGMRDRQSKYNTNLEVIRNQKMQTNNTSGVKGVDYHKGRRMWRGRVSIGGKELTKWSKDKDVVIQWRKDAIEKYYKPKIGTAIKNGDLKEDGIESVTTFKVYHGSRDGRSPDEYEKGEWTFLTDSIKVAESFTYGDPNALFECDIEIRNPFKFDALGKSFNDLPNNIFGFKHIDDIKKYVEQHSEFDGAIIFNVFEHNIEICTDYMINDPSKIKSFKIVNYNK